MNQPLPLPYRTATPQLSPLPERLVARLWLKATDIGESDGDARLWLHLTDGRVVALRLPSERLGDDLVLASLIEAIFDDPRGMYHEWLDQHTFGWAFALYAAPVIPLFRAFDNNRISMPGMAKLRFAAALDLELIEFLTSLEGTFFWCSVRNYNRLVLLPPDLRMRRMQALQRFAALVAPILLTMHHSPNLFDGKRHAYRQADTDVENAIDFGQDLVGALARHYGLSRGHVRAPCHIHMWPANYATRGKILSLFEALPPNKRPQSTPEITAHMGQLVAYFSLLPDLALFTAEIHRKAFHLGWSKTWDVATTRFGNVNHAIVDAGDFLRAVAIRAAHLLGRPQLPVSRLTQAWLREYGLLALLAASARWHANPARRMSANLPDDLCLSALLGIYQDASHQARELRTPKAFAEEGQVMQHCVADYWQNCLEGDRIFSLQLANGELATAQYHTTDPFFFFYKLVQLRGPKNATVSEPMQQWAQFVVAQINQPARLDNRRSAQQLPDALNVDQTALQRVEACVVTAPLDGKTEHQLARLLQRFEPVPHRQLCLLQAEVAGLHWHAAPELIAKLRPGQQLQLSREPDNPHDPMAVRIDWLEQQLGYVPRPHNTAIARLLDQGEQLVAQLNFQQPARGTLEFVISRSADEPAA